MAGGGTSTGAAAGGAPDPISALQGMSGGQAAGMLGNSMPGGTSGAIGNALMGPGTSAPQWLKGLQLGQQLSQGAQAQHPQMQMMPQRPGMGAPSQGMPSGVVPGAGGMMPPQMQPPQMSGAMPQSPMQGQGGINPQLLQMLLRSRGQM